MTKEAKRDIIMLVKKGQKTTGRRWFKKRYLLLIILLVGLAGFYFYIVKDLPSPATLSSDAQPQSTKIYDRNGALLYTIYANKNATFVPLSHIPDKLQHATIAIEDKDFYKHGAVDFRGIARAAYLIATHKQFQGGSTLTQQLVKTSLLSPERTLTRKVKEVVLSFATEVLYSKDKILEMYLNQVPYGGTAYGVEAAAQTYFGKRVKDVSLAEAAFLAGLPESPTTFSPFGSHPELAKERQEIILQKMYEQGYIKKDEMEQAKKEKLHFQQVSNNIRAPHFVLYVKDLLVKKYGSKLVEEGGLKVTTSLDLTLQDFTQDTVATEVAALKNYHVSNGAVTITKPGTGEILAMVGSRNYFDTEETDGNVNITLAHLQPGSSIKPINYATGLIKGFTAATPFIDQALCFPSGSASYCPRNYDGKFSGVVQMRQALGNSKNIPAVEMLKMNGIDAMIATASAMGITTFTDPSKYGLSLTLGGGEVTMLDMATAYGVFANQGYRVDLHPILRITDAKGQVLEEYKPPNSAMFGKRVIPAGVAYIISHILLDNNARIAEFGANSELKIDNQPVSVKTGTTNDFRDNWTIGYDSDFLVATWVGNNDHTPMNNLASGITGAAPIWNKIMRHLLEKTPAKWPNRPYDVIGKYICSTSGLVPPADGTPDKCPTRFEYFIKGTEPKQTDPGRQKVFIDKGTNDLAKEGQTDNVEERMEVVVTDALKNRYCVTCPHPTPTPKP
jgi:1A family penicillin-binding protein